MFCTKKPVFPTVCGITGIGYKKYKGVEKMNRNRQEKGITLIALVVTIIVLLILADLRSTRWKSRWMVCASA